LTGTNSGVTQRETDLSKQISLSSISAHWTDFRSTPDLCSLTHSLTLPTAVKNARLIYLLKASQTQHQFLSTL
ncbi:MAG: hypothetical protein QG625_1350, partial [Cyanobacteriota bacterium erpe_2018_sw_39hr_WHONDRS-SW48-000098_B_bin.30]|nr:hypothetical protein [Cyanobacteriota bacterium erpe_2018_sw_39hr_WHONDRS-SW48-000098_B_bin.30]